MRRLSGRSLVVVVVVVWIISLAGRFIAVLFYVASLSALSHLGVILNGMWLLEQHENLFFLLVPVLGGHLFFSEYLLMAPS